LGSLYGIGEGDDRLSSAEINKYGKEVGHILSSFVKFREDSSKDTENDSKDTQNNQNPIFEYEIKETYKEELTEQLEGLITCLQKHGDKLNIKLIEDFARELNAYHNHLYLVNNDSYFSSEKVGT